MHALFFTLVLVPVPQDAPDWRPTGTVEPLPGKVQSYVLSADGTRAATVGEDKRLIVWNVPERAVLAAYGGAGEYAVRLAFSPDSAILAAAYPWWSEVQCRAFDARTGKELTPLEKLPLGEGETYSQRGKDGGRAKKVVGPALYRHRSGATVFHPADHRFVVASSRPKLAAPPTRWRQKWRISNDGARVAVFRTKGLVGGRIPQGTKNRQMDARIYEVATGNELAEQTWDDLVPKSTPYYTEALGFDFEHLAFVREGAVEVYRFRDKHLVASFGTGVRSLLSPTAGEWLTGHEDGTVRRWRGETQVGEWQGPAKPLRYLRIEGDVIFTGMHGTVAALAAGRLQRLDQTTVQGTASGPYLMLREWRKIHVFEDGERLVSLPADQVYNETDNRNIPVRIAGHKLAYVREGALRIHDLASGKDLGAMNAHSERLLRLDWGAGGILAHGWRRAALVDPDTLQVVRRYATRAVRFAGARVIDFGALTKEKPRRMAVSRDGSTCAVLDGTTVRAFRTSDMKEIWRRGGNARHAPLALSADGKMIATASSDRRTCTLRLFSLPNGEPLLEKRVPARRVEHVELDPTATKLALRVAGFSAGSGNVVFYGIDGTLLHHMRTGPAAMGEDEYERSFAFTPDGRHALGASFAGPVEVYDFDERERVLAFDAPRHTYSHFVRLFPSPTGRTFALYYSERDTIYWISVSDGLDKEARITTRNAGHAAAFLPNGDLLAAAFGSVELWSERTRRKKGSVPGAEGQGIWTGPGGRRFALTEASRLRIFERR